jgi:choice-of-anchor B domain-containing protein
MNSNYDGSGTTYAGYNILTDDPDVLYAWWPKVAAGRTFFETPTAKLQIKTFIGLNVSAYENEVLLDWVYPGDPPSYYKLYWGNTNPPTNLLGTFSAATTGYVHTNLTKSLNYYYQLKAYNVSDIEINASAVKLGTTAEWANQMNIAGHWDGRGNDYGACWGWTNPQTGREYGLICARNAGVSIVDLDTLPLTEVGFIPGASSGVDVKEVRCWKNIAVVISEGASTQIVDISDPYNPDVLSTITGGRHCCMVDSHFVYLSGGPPGGLAIWSIENPSSPVLMDQYNPYYYHDYAIYNDTVAAFAIYGEGIDLLDVTDKTDIQLIGHFNYANSGAHNGAFSNDGNHLFIGDEIGAGRWTRCFNVSDPTNVSFVSNLIVPGAQVVHNCYLKGDYLVISHYSEGVRIWNVANPAAPFEVAYFDTFPTGAGGFTGCWHNYPYFPSGRIVASDMTYGLYLLTSPLLPPDPGCCVGTRGDLNSDGSFNTDILDLTFAVDRIFRGGDQPGCDDEGDINADGTVCNILDLTFIIDLIFRGGAQPSACP